jgi:hypothetical protein
MARLRNFATGAVVNVSDEKAARLSSNGWGAAGDESAAPGTADKDSGAKAVVTSSDVKGNDNA